MKPVPGFPGYLVTAEGDVLSRRTAMGLRLDYRRMKSPADAKGYRTIVLCNGRETRRAVRVHRLVAELFVPNPDCKPCIRHLDGNAQNNAAYNLAWGSYAENEHDKRIHGTYWHRTGKLTPLDRYEIRQLRTSGRSCDYIAALFILSRSTIYRLLLKETK